MNNIKLTFDDMEILVKLDDNIVTREFMKELPLVLTFNDYSRAEKIAYISKKYWTDNLVSKNYCPSKGDLMFYPPWGYLALFYNDYIVSEGYVKLGEVISGLIFLDKLKGNVRIEKSA